MTDKKKKDIIEAIVEIQLVYPYNVSYEGMIRFVNTFGMRLVGSNTSSPKAKIAISSKKFKSIFGKNPQVGEDLDWKEISGFIKKMKVIELKVRKT